MTEVRDQIIHIPRANERGKITTCNKCKAEYCIAKKCKPETDGCIVFYYLPDLKTLRWFTPFTWKQVQEELEICT